MSSLTRLIIASRSGICEPPMESVYVPTFQQGGGPGFEHTAPQPAAAATPTEAGAREHRFSPYVDNGGCASSPFLKMT